MELPDIVETLCRRCDGTDKNELLGKPKSQPLPSRDAIIQIVEELRAVIFPGYFGTSDINMKNMRFHVGSALDHLTRVITLQVRRGLCFLCDQANSGSPACSVCDTRAEEITQIFTSRLPYIQKMLLLDIQAAFEGDPAAVTPDEAIFCYPGILAVTNYRIAHELYKLKVPVIPRIISEHAHSITGVDIHPGATIGESFFMDHGTGIVIGETSIIGKRVKLYQGVTMGAKSFPKDENGKPVKGVQRHPIVEDDVTVYSNATILGRITIGKGSVIGGNVWLTHSVAPGSKISQGSLNEENYADGGGI
ncbi:MAG: serine acetyltransferase [Deltaproteobacteria bacterium]|nr:serine acetyltransferase [Deltaproteobacteria bacterium]